MGCPGGPVIKTPPASSGDRCRRSGFDPRVGKIPWRKKGLCTPVFLLGKSHAQRSQAGWSPRGHRAGHDSATEHAYMKAWDLLEKTIEENVHNLRQSGIHPHDHKYHGKSPPTNTITVGVQISTHKIFRGDTNVQTSAINRYTNSQKVGKDVHICLIRYFSKEDPLMASKHQQSCSTSLFIRRNAETLGKHELSTLTDLAIPFLVPPKKWKHKWTTELAELFFFFE